MGIGAMCYDLESYLGPLRRFTWALAIQLQRPNPLRRDLGHSISPWLGRNHPRGSHAMTAGRAVAKNLRLVVHTVLGAS